MSLHFYAGNPAQRMVRIDDRILREGQTLADDLVLEEITPRGVIFSSSGERVELQRPGGQP
jgi:general secretion pathway protein B